MLAVGLGPRSKIHLGLLKQFWKSNSFGSDPGFHHSANNSVVKIHSNF